MYSYWYKNPLKEGIMDLVTAAAKNDTEAVAVIIHAAGCSENRNGKRGCKELTWGWWLREANTYIREARKDATKLHDAECRRDHTADCRFYSDEESWDNGIKLYWFREANSPEIYEEEDEDELEMCNL